METYERLVVGPFPFRSLPPLGVENMVDDVWEFAGFGFDGDVDAGSDKSVPLTAAGPVMSREQELAGDG